MAAVSFSTLLFQQVDPSAVAFGTVTEPPQGGQDEMIDRLGDRWALTFATKPYPYEPTGREYAADFGVARKRGAIVPVRMPGFVIGTPGSSTLSANPASGRLLPLTGLTPGYAIRKGQWLNYSDAAGHLYLDRVATAVTASGGGTATVEIENLLRVPLLAGAAIDLANPRIEGRIVGDVGESWQRTRLVAFNFTVRETA